MDVLLDRVADDTNPLSASLLNPLGGRVINYPRRDVKNAQGVVTTVVADKQRLFRAAAVCVFLALNLFGILFTRVDNEGHKGVMDGDGLNIAAIVAVSLHLVLGSFSLSPRFLRKISLLLQSQGLRFFP